MIFRKIERVFPESINHFFLALEGNNIIATAEIGVTDKHDTTPVLYGLFVKKSYRKKGIARKLIEIRIEFLEYTGYKHALCYIHPSNTVSINLLKSYGFQKMDEEKSMECGSEWYKLQF